MTEVNVDGRVFSFDLGVEEVAQVLLAAGATETTVPPVAGAPFKRAGMPDLTPRKPAT